jgi:hypothetical protein
VKFSVGIKKSVELGHGRTEIFTLGVHFSVSYRTFGVRGGAFGLKRCATSRKVAGSIPDVVTEIFH